MVDARSDEGVDATSDLTRVPAPSDAATWTGTDADGEPRDAGPGFPSDPDARPIMEFSACVPIGAVCDATTIDQGCLGGDVCQLNRGGPLTAMCGPPGHAVLGAQCSVSSDCGPGLQCIQDVCLPLCCVDPTAVDPCPRATGLPHSHCAVRVPGQTSVAGCTLGSVCDFTTTDAGCDPSSVCYPSSRWGDGECVTQGTLPLGAPCTHLYDCAGTAICWPHDQPDGGVGRCRRTCFVGDPYPCGPSSHVSDCAQPDDLPLDFPRGGGVCPP
jgi:hypothetical protein